jgi:hypothetical protein
VPAVPRGRISWPAIFAGAVLVIAVELLLSALGTGVGLGLVHPGSSQTPAAGSLGTGAGIWWLISTIIALLIGSYATARLASVTARYDGMLHGLVVWGVTLLVVVYLITSAVGGLIGGAFSVLGNAVSSAGTGIKAAAPQGVSATGLSPEMIQQQARDFLQSGNQEPATMSLEDAQKAIARALPDLAAGGDRATQAKNRIIDIMAAQLKISRGDAAKRFDEAEARFNQVRQQAVQTATTADQTATAASGAAFMAFAAMLIGAIAAGIGGALASPQSPWWPVRRTSSFGSA